MNSNSLAVTGEMCYEFAADQFYDALFREGSSAHREGYKIRKAKADVTIAYVFYMGRWYETGRRLRTRRDTRRWVVGGRC